MVKKFISIYNVPNLMFFPLRWILSPMYQNSLIIYAPPPPKEKPYAFSSQSVTVLIITMNMFILAN